MDTLQNALKNSVSAVQKRMWDLFITSALAAQRQHQKLAYSLVFMRRLIDTDRACVQDPSVGTTIGFICHLLDDNTFRYMMKFLLAKDEDASSLTKRIKNVVWFNSDISDSWNTSFPDTIGMYSTMTPMLYMRCAYFLHVFSF